MYGSKPPDPFPIGRAIVVELRQLPHLAPDLVELVLDVQFDGDPYITSVVVDGREIDRTSWASGRAMTVSRSPGGAIAIVGTSAEPVPECADGKGRGAPAAGGPWS